MTKTIYKLTVNQLCMGSFHDEEGPCELFFATKERMIESVLNDLTEAYDDDNNAEPLEDLVAEFENRLYIVVNDEIEYSAKKCRLIGA
jgi:hypothetical protein